MTDRYDPQAIEAKWQDVWRAERAFNVPNPGSGGAAAEKTYVLEMLPYPSGELHMGHVRNYMLGEVVTHFRRRHGYQVLRPMGFDSFGLPSENAAIQQGAHPRVVTERNIAAIRAQMERLGWAIDWDRVLATHEPAYYRWTQWLFLKFFEHGHVYRKQVAVKWCPNDQTVLANEQVIDGHCERCGALVESRNLEQWLFRITAYADALLDEMASLESWPERVLTMQRNWIGRSEGAEVIFRVDGEEIDIPVFTTRPDTLFGATFFVLAPENPLVPKLVTATAHEQDVMDYVRLASARSSVERETKEKDGVFTGRFVINPADGARIPVWVADYVLMEYGTGAIMAVPAHDERDFAFARKYDLPIRVVVVSGGSAPAAQGMTEATTNYGTLVNSGAWDGQEASNGSKGVTALALPSGSGSATGCCHGSAIGDAPSRSCIATNAGSCPSPRTSSRLSCRRSTTTSPRGARRSRPPRNGSASTARAAVAKHGARRTRWTRSSIRRGTSCGTAMRGTRRRRSSASSSTTGCPSTSTSAGSSTRSCICCTRAFSSKR